MNLIDNYSICIDNKKWTKGHLAIFAIINVGKNTSLGDVINLSDKINLGNWGGLAVFAVLTATLCYSVLSTKKKK